MKKQITSLRIFILDDTVFDQKTIKEFLTEIVFKDNKKIKITQSYSLIEAEKQLKGLKDLIDLFILDGTLNPNFGFDLIPAIKKTNPNAKIVMCSGNSDLNKKGYYAGADMGIPKGDIGSNKPIEKQHEFAKELLELLNS